MIAALILAAGAGVYGVALLYAAITTHRLTGRLRTVEQRLANLAQINTDLRLANTAVPDAATPDLMARIDDLPQRRRSMGREMERWSDLIGRAERAWAPVVPPHVDPPYKPTPAEAHAWRSIVDHIRREASS